MRRSKRSAGTRPLPGSVPSRMPSGRLMAEGQRFFAMNQGGGPEGTDSHRHLLGLQGMHPTRIEPFLDLAESYVLLNRSRKTQRDLLRGRTLINLFFEDSTRTRTSFELAGKRLVVRHAQSGAPALIARKVDASVINAGDGTHEHPTQALLDALTIRRRCGRLAGLTVAICGDITHSRVARSNIHLLTAMGSQVRVIGPPTLMPAAIERLGVEVFHNMEAGLRDVVVV